MITDKILYKDDNGDPVTGLTLTVLYLIRVSDNESITPVPAITEIANGWYKFDFNNDEAEEYLYRIDCGVIAGITARYADGAIEKSVRSMDTFFKNLKAVNAGNREVTDNGNGTYTETFMQDDGVTPQISGIIDADGNRVIQG